MNIEEMNEFLISINGLNRTYREDRGPIIDARYFGVGEGWFPIIKSMIEELIEIGWDKRIAQVKEKFGGLRFYLETYPEGAGEIISKYEKMSYKTCEKCGEEGTQRNNGWIKTLCDKHAEERNMKTINVQGIIVRYDLEALANEVNNIPYDRQNYVDNHRTSGDGVSLHEGAPTEYEFIELRTKFANDILNLETTLVNRIELNLFLTKKGVMAKNRRRPILTGDTNFYVNVIDEYDHDLQFDKPYVKLDRIDEKEGKLIIHVMQTNY